MYFTDIPSPIGTLRLASDGTALTGLWLKNQKYFAAGLEPEAESTQALPIFQTTILWLDTYFAGKQPLSLPPLSPRGSEFRQAVWNLLLGIPYGQTSTYGQLAKKLNSSPRAIGNAVGHNPISILIPCHRVLGADGGLTGYAGGLEKKRSLLKLEQAYLARQKKALTLPEMKSTPCESLPASLMSDSPVPGKFPCPCCGYLTFPIPKEDALAHICPVCYWENDVFDPGDEHPSDENHGMTLRQGREAFQKFKAVRKEFLCYVREPFPEEIP